MQAPGNYIDNFYIVYYPLSKTTCVWIQDNYAGQTPMETYHEQPLWDLFSGWLDYVGYVMLHM